MRKILTLIFSLFALCTYHHANACHSGGIRPSAVTYTIGGTATAPTLTVNYPLASPRTNCGSCGYCMVYRLYEEQSCGTSTFIGGTATASGTWNPTCASIPAAPEVVNITTNPLAVCPGKTYYIAWTAQDACTGGAALDPVDLNNSAITTGPLGYAASGTFVVTIPGEMPWGLNLTLNEPDALSNCNAPSPGIMAYNQTLADGPTAVVKPSMELICGQLFDINWAMDNFCSNYVWNTAQVSILKDGALVAGPSARNEADNGNYVDACVSAAHTYSVCIQEGTCHDEDNFQGNGATNVPQCFDFPVTVINSTNTSLAFDQAIYCYGDPVTLTGAGTVYGNIDAVHDIVVNGTKYANGVIIDGTTGSCNIGTTSPNTLSGVNDGTYGYGTQTYTSFIRYTPACATCPPSPIPANAIFLEQLNAAFVSESCNATGGIDIVYTLTGGSPQYNATDAYTVSNLSLGTLSPAVISAGSPKTITISIPSSTSIGTAITFDVSDTYGCSRSFSYNTVTEAPPAPSPVGNNSVCQGASSVPVANQLTATCAACAVPACTDVCAPCATGAPTSTTISLGSNSEDYFGYCELCGACSTLPGGDACGDNPSTTPDFGCGGGSVNTFNVTVSTPPSTIPPCATLNYTITGDFTSINGSFAGELFVRITPPGGSPTVYNPGAGVCSGTNQTFTIASGPGTPTAGSWLIEMSDVYNDSDSGADGNLAVNVNVVYTVPTLPPPPPPVPADITWYDAPTGGTVQGTGSPFDPTGKISAQGPVDLSLPGNYTFYANCGCGDCESTRTPVIFTVIPKAAGPSVDDEELCIGGTVPTITPIGSAIGSLFNIYALGTTIPLNAAPQGQFTSANLVSYGFNPNVVGETTYLVTEITDPTGLACESNPTAFSITVNPAPTPTASNSGPYCEGETIEVSATGGFFYNWSGPGGYAASGSPAFRFDADPTMAGTYNVTVTNLQGCTAATNTTVVVNANPGPPTVTANDACINTALTAADFLSASCSGTITWWNSPVGGTQQGTGTTLDPTGKVALQGAFSIATPGVYTFFAQCADATTGCLSTRQPVSFTVYPSPIPAAFNNGPICSGQSVTITATGGASYSWSNGATTASATVSPTTTTPYTVTVTSSNGCTATASTTVVVYPNPTATIAALTYTVCEDGTVVIDGGASGGTALYTYVWGGAGAPFLVNATLSDPLFDASLTVPGSYPLTLQIIDANGCSSTVASTTVNVVGGGAPVISCPANVLLSTDNGLCTTQYQPTAPTTNNGCYGDLILTYALTGVTTGSGTGAVPSTDFNIGATTITYTVTDANVSTATATCSFTVTVEDEQPPVIACPASITQSSGAGTCTASVTVPLPLTVTDNCTASPTVTYALTGATTGSGAGAATGTYNVGVTIVTYTATDAAGNTAACQLTVTVVENILPTITCPSNLTRTVVADGTSNCTYTATTAEVSPTIGDNCTAVTVAANVSYIAFGATTAVGSGAATLNYNVGTTFVTYTVVDASGNTRQCTFSVVVTDNTAPVLVCPAPVTMNATSCSGFADVPPLGVTDNCGAGVVSTSFIIRNTNNLGNNNTIVRSGLGTNASGAFPVGVSTITFTSTDAAGNTASCSSTVTVNDVVPPIIVCPSSGDIIVNSSNDGTGDCETAVNIESVVAYDNCENVVITYVVQHFSTSSPATVVATVTGGNVGNFTSGGATWTSDPSASGDFSVGLNIVTYTATDRYGNTATCSIRVTVLDNENPTITCPANVQLPNATGTCGSPVTIPVPVTADNCGIRSVINNYNNTNNASDTYPVGLTTVIWTVTDINGNTATCGMFVRIDDNEVPNVICQNITIGVNSTSPTSITPSQVFNTNSTDNCGSVVPVSVSPNSFICPQNESTNTVTLVVSDTRGNTASCQATVTVVCCVAEAGNVQLAQSPCPNQAISLSASGYMIDPGYSHWYIVTNSSGQIVWAQQAGATATIPANTLPVGQNYCLYGYSVKTSTATSAPTGNISSIATWATCNDLSSPCRQFYVPNNPPALLGSSNISQGNQGGISPFYYNTNTVTVWGGTAPYQFTWDNTGYVRYDVFYGNVDHDNNPATPAIPGATITVFYADSASWAVTVTDSNACSTVNLPFGNIPSQVNTLLDIDSHTINSQTSTVSPNGSITLCVTGGPAGCVPTYSWSLPNGQTLTTSNTIGIPPCPLTSNSTNLPNLSYGWYSVTVTCGGESTQGWYWVPRQRRGRNKDDMQQAINISPNPFATVTEIKFAVEQSGMTRVAVYSVDGKEVALLFNEQADADETYTLSFDGSNLASGVYVVKVESEGGTVETAKLMLTK